MFDYRIMDHTGSAANWKLHLGLHLMEHGLILHFLLLYNIQPNT